jgi:hypothetical protein
MDEFRLNMKFPRWIVTSHIYWFFLGVLNIISSLFIHEDENVNISKEGINNKRGSGIINTKTRTGKIECEILY